MIFRFLRRYATFILTLISLGVFAGVGLVVFLVVHYSKDLPDYRQLANYSPPMVTRLYASDGQMMAEYAKEKRLFVPIDAIPKRIVNAFIAAEDQNFYHHPGIDFVSIMRAMVQNVINVGSGRSLVGGSTITQQVVKNFLLTNEQSLSRKIKEAILAFRITQAFPKDTIMELYLNEIFLGKRSYGVAAAALNYFGKSLDQITIEEAALLASMPKAPSHLDPEKFPKRALERRNWVIDRMEEEGFITPIEATLAGTTKIELASHKDTLFDANFFAEEVRRRLVEQYGEEGIYEGGLAINTTLNPTLQRYAETALRHGLLSYDKRHGYRGPLASFSSLNNWEEKLKTIDVTPEAPDWKKAIILSLNASHATIGLPDGSKGTIGLSELSWARRFIDQNTVGDKIKRPSDAISKGDVVLVRPLHPTAINVPTGDDQKDNTPTNAPKIIHEYALEQIPNVNGALVAIDPITGQVRAMIGGYYFGGSQFNRATQAFRQPGSAFKPFVYLAAMENGFAPNSIIVDEEIQLEMGTDMPGWRPQNHSGKYYGPSPLRLGLEKSRNAMTVRLAQEMGLNKVIEVSKRYDLNQNPEHNFSVPLGSAETTLLKLTNAYAMIANGGKRVTPYFIENIADRHGKTVYRHDKRPCEECLLSPSLLKDETPPPPYLADTRQQIADPIANYQILSMLEGVIKRGTGRSAASINHTLVGKTGTTNDSVDAWFVGSAPNLAVGVFVGFDTPRSLGKHEYGSSAALPIWKEFMQKATDTMPDVPFSRPDGIRLVRIDLTTGQLPNPGTPSRYIIDEAFRIGTEPTSSNSIRTRDGSTGEEDHTNDDVGSGAVY